MPPKKMMERQPSSSKHNEQTTLILSSDNTDNSRHGAKEGVTILPIIPDSINTDDDKLVMSTKRVTTTRFNLNLSQYSGLHPTLEQERRRLTERWGCPNCTNHLKLFYARWHRTKTNTTANCRQKRWRTRRTVTNRWTKKSQLLSVT